MCGPCIFACEDFIKLLFCDDVADLVDKDPMTSDLFVRNVLTTGVGIAFQQYSLAIDGLVEGEECLLFIVSVNETELDPRDQGQVNISNGVALFRIQDLNGEWRKLLSPLTRIQVLLFFSYRRANHSTRYVSLFLLFC